MRRLHWKKALARGAALWAILFLLGPACTNETGPEPNPSPLVDVDRLDFGNVPIGTTAERRFVVRNRGDAPLAGRVEEDCSEFAILEGAGEYDLAPGESLEVIVRFSPVDEGTVTCGVRVESRAVVRCVGTGSPALPSCSIEPASQDFGAVAVGSYVDRVFTLRNAGGGQLTGVVGAGCGAFAVLVGGGSFDLAGGESRVVRVRFAPEAVGPQACAIPVDGGGCGEIPCSGQGAPPPGSCLVAPSSLDYGAVVVGESAIASFTLTNVGPGVLDGLVGSGCPEFVVEEGGGAFELEANATLTVTIRFTPAEYGIRSCLVQLGTALCPAVPCTGNGTPGPACQATPASLDFGIVQVGSFRDRSFTIVNDGGGALTGSVTSPCPQFTLAQGGGAFELHTGQTRTVVVRFTPTGAGETACTIDLGTAACAPVTCEAVGVEPACLVTPLDLDFGAVEVGTFRDLSFTIRNDGGGILTGLVEEACAPFALVGGGGSFQLNQGEERVVTVRFAPATGGPASCTISTGPECPAVHAAGYGTTDEGCEVTPTEIAFGSVGIGGSLDRSFTITNTGQTRLSGTATEDCADFSIVSGVNWEIDPGGIATVVVRFSPSIIDPQICVIRTGNPVCPVVTATGEGHLTTPLCSLDPASLDFGIVRVGEFADNSFTIRNTGGGTLSGQVSESCDDFSLLSGSGPFSLGPNEAVTVLVRFEPASEGVKSCTVETGSADCVDLPCTGTGEELPVCVIEPASIDFGNVLVGTSVDTTFTVRNAGGGTLTGSISSPCAEFTIAAGGGEYELAGGEEHTVTLRFAPAVEGPRACTIETGAACPGLPAGGTGFVPAPACSVSPSALDFGLVLVGNTKDLPFVIKNTGGAPFSGAVSDAACPADISIPTGGGPYTLAAGESLEVVVRFAPRIAGPQSCRIETGSDLCVDVDVQGEGVEEIPICTITPSTLEFGGVDVGQTRDRSFTITNDGEGRLVGSVSEDCAFFSIVAGGGAYDLGPQQSRTVTVRYAPTAVGDHACTIETGSVRCADVPCTGTGLGAICRVEPTALDFGDILVGQSRTLSFRIVNDGNANLAGSVNETCAHYTLTAGGGAYNLGPGQERVVDVRFAPTSPGAKLCTIETGNALCSDVSCTGTGVGPICVVEPTVLDFGDVQTGQTADRSFTITNTGGGTLSGTVGEACAEFSIVSGGGAFNLTNGQVATVTVRFAPLTEGPAVCTVTLGNNLCTDVACQGRGVAPPPACLVSPTTLDFGNVEIGQFAERSFTITNTGGGTLSGDPSESCEDFSIVSGGEPYNLGAGQVRTVTVQFRPFITGPRACTVETGNALCSDVACSGTGTPAPACLVSPTSLDFGNVLVGQFAERSFTITNTGGGILSGNVSESCAEFSLQSGGGVYNLGTGQVHTVVVRFTPASEGLKNCIVDTGTNLCSDVSCAGTGIGPICSVSPTTLDFGSVEIGQFAERSFTITNTGGGTLSGDPSENCTDFSIFSGGDPYNLTAGQVRTVVVRFEPVGTGPRACTVETGNALCSDVACSGTGTPAPACLVSPTTLDFGSVEVGQFAERSFTITNTGGGTLSGNVSENCAEFSIQSGGGVYNLGAGQVHTVVVRFTPASEGLKNCTVDTGATLCSDVSCSGTGTPPPACSVSPTTLDFGTVDVGQFAERSFTITNTGGGTLSGDPSEDCEDFSIESGGEPYDLTAGQVRTVVVRFSPASEGLRSCTVDTGTTLCSDVSCSGTGASAPVCSVSPTTLDFGDVLVDATADLTFRIKNLGGGTLTGNVSEPCGDYSIPAGEGPFSLAAGESLVVTVRFAPTAEGALPCTVDTGTALCSDVSCTGTGIGPACSVFPTSLDFGGIQIGQFTEQSFTITNTGGGTLSGVVSENCEDFSIVSGGEAYNLTAGAVHTVVVQFAPGSLGLKNCTIETGNDGECADVAASGTGCVVCPASPITRNVAQDVTITNGALVPTCTDTQLLVGDSLGAVVEYEALLQFVLTDIPTNAIVTSATLQFFPEGCVGLPPDSSVTVTLADLAASFDPCTVTWDSAPARTALASCSAAVGCSQPGRFDFSCPALLDLVQNWVATPTSNHGLALIGPGTRDGHLLVRSLEGNGPAPRLVVAFTCPCP